MLTEYLFQVSAAKLTYNCLPRQTNLLKATLTLSCQIQQEIVLKSQLDSGNKLLDSACATFLGFE